MRNDHDRFMSITDIIILSSAFQKINADSYSGDEVLTSKEGLLRRRKGDSKSRDTKSTYNNHFEHIVFFQPTMPC